MKLSFVQHQVQTSSFALRSAIRTLATATSVPAVKTGNHHTTRRTPLKQQSDPMESIDLHPNHSNSDIVATNKWVVNNVLPVLQEQNMVDEHFQAMVKRINVQHDLRFQDLDLLQACFIRTPGNNRENWIQDLNPPHDISMVGGGGSLEFLGDAVINFLSKMHTVNENVVHGPEKLTRASQALVSNQTLNHVFRTRIMLGLDCDKDVIHISTATQPDTATARTTDQHSKWLADHMESIFGAKYLDGGFIETCHLFQRMLPHLKRARVLSGASENPIGQATECYSRLSFKETDQIDNRFLLKYVHVNRKGQQGELGSRLTTVKGSKYVFDLPNIVDKVGSKKITLEKYVEKNKKRQSIVAAVLLDCGVPSTGHAFTHADGVPLIVVGYGAAQNKKTAKTIAARSVLNHRREAKVEILTLLKMKNNIED